MVEDADEVMQAIRESAELAMEAENAAALESVSQEIIEIQEAVMNLHKDKQRMAVTTAEYIAKVQTYKDRMIELEDQQKQLQSTQVRYAEVVEWLRIFQQHMETGDIMNADDGLIVKALVEEIIVGDESIEIRFKCGASIEQAYEK